MNVFDLFAKISLDTKDYDKGLSDASKGFKTLVSTAKNTIGNIAKISAAGIATGAGAIAALTKNAVSNFAEYEQLVGGVETLFKKSQDKVIEYANIAYKTAGLSANEYMETVTSFSASLLQSLGGDTKKSAQYADQAIVDMADNANKMGTSIESIQNAYQGFAKQTYNMLDNLKLGYGGTQEEMYRLLQDAAKLNKEFANTANFSIDEKGHLKAKFSDIVQAIHIVQTEMGITGTTAKEAATTISGSLNMAKASFKNLMTSLGNKDANLSEYVKEFADSSKIFLSNVIPVAKQVVNGISTVFDELVPIISDTLPDLVVELLPSLIKGATQLFIGLAKALPQILLVITQQIPFIASSIIDGFREIAPEMISSLVEIGRFIFEYVFNDILGMDLNFDEFTSKLSDGFRKSFQVIEDTWNTIGKPIFHLIQDAAKDTYFAFEDSMPGVEKSFKESITGINDSWENHLKPCFKAIGDFIENYLRPIFHEVFEIWLSPVITNSFEAIAGAWTNILKPNFDKMCDFIQHIFTGRWKEAMDDYVGIIRSRFETAKEMIHSYLETIKTVFSNAIDFLKEKLNFTWELPKIKLPHFNIRGEFSLNPISVPHIDVDWYAKAMNSPMIMNSPTAFGINNKGQIMMGGESGSEVVAGTSTLMNMIENAVNNGRNQTVIDYDRLASSIVSALEGFKVEMNGTTVGKMMNKELYTLQSRGAMV